MPPQNKISKHGNDRKTGDTLKGGLAVLLVVSTLAVMIIALSRRSADIPWRKDAAAADLLAFSRESARAARYDSLRKAGYKERLGSERLYEKRPPRILNIELNGADSAELCRVYGIGPVFSSRIIHYRQQLGGYVHIRQLAEVKGITEEVFERISPNFWIDSMRIQKIDINFATRDQLLAHPYVTPSMAGRILRGVKMKGGYITLKQLTESDILLPGEARKLAPYLSFKNKSRPAGDN